VIPNPEDETLFNVSILQGENGELTDLKNIEWTDSENIEWFNFEKANSAENEKVDSSSSEDSKLSNVDNDSTLIDNKEASLTSDEMPFDNFQCSLRDDFDVDADLRVLLSSETDDFTFEKDEEQDDAGQNDESSDAGLMPFLWNEIDSPPTIGEILSSVTSSNANDETELSNTNDTFPDLPMTASEIELLLRSETDSQGSGIDENDRPSNSNEAGAEPRSEAGHFEDSDEFPSSSPLPSSRYILYLYLEFEVALLPLVPESW
jgi:hypothetical protein